MVAHAFYVEYTATRMFYSNGWMFQQWQKFLLFVHGEYRVMANIYLMIEKQSAKLPN